MKTRDWIRFFGWSNNRRWIVGVRLWSWDQTAKCGMALIKFSTSEESMHDQMQGENYDYCFFFYSCSIVHKEFVPPGQTVNHAFYKDVLERLQKQVQWVRMDTADNWVLHLDNVPADTAFSFWEFLAKENIPIVPHPPCGPDLALCDFYLFPKLKSKLKSCHFGTMESIQKIVTDELQTLMDNDRWYCYD